MAVPNWIRKHPAVTLIGVTALAVLILALWGPIPQPSSYHDFADQRVLRIPHFMDILSNLPFLFIGVAGLVVLRRKVPPGGLPALRPPYFTFFIGTALLFPGSAYYHFAPSNSTLLWDRLPMTIVFMAAVSFILGEHISPRLGRRLLIPLLILGALSVFHWRWTDSGNGGDLRLYILVQYLTLILIALVLFWYPSALEPKRYLWALLGFYGLAKVLECLDKPLFQATRFASGHTLKHLAASIGIYFFLLGLIRRRPAYHGRGT